MQIGKSNNLIYTLSKVVRDEAISIKIQLGDDCKNGHQDFSVTGNIYQAGKPQAGRYFISGGCIHEDIAKHFPQFIHFIKLHLCDYDGVPMYATENGFYHLKHGFNNCLPDSIKFEKKYQEYYRITKRQFNALKAAKSETQYNDVLVATGILTQWKEEAQKAIKELQQLTGLSFINDSVRSNYKAVTPEEREEENKKITTGYYTPEAEILREETKKQNALQALQNELSESIEKHTLEYKAKKEVLLKGGEKALKCCIYYPHTKEINFNWTPSELLPIAKVMDLIRRLNLPTGVTAKIDNRNK
jgi:hypothetical protein